MCYTHEAKDLHKEVAAQLTSPEFHLLRKFDVLFNLLHPQYSHLYLKPDKLQ